MGMIIFSSEVVKSFQSLSGNTRELSEPSLGNIKKMTKTTTFLKTKKFPVIPP